MTSLLGCRLLKLSGTHTENGQTQSALSPILTGQSDKCCSGARSALAVVTASRLALVTVTLLVMTPSTPPRDHGSPRPCSRTRGMARCPRDLRPSSRLGGHRHP